MNTDRGGAKVTLFVNDRIAVITIDNPPVNAGSQAVRAGLLAAFGQAEALDLQGAILIGAGRSFIAGSDLKEFGRPLVSPELPDVIRAVENLPFPVVAALHGVALGGGLELALGCDYRIASTSTKLGLPEVSLGMVPGAGGTQRLPRLVGKTRAIEMICGSLRIDAADALRDGLIDALAKDDLLATAMTFLTQVRRPKRLARDLNPPASTQSDVDAAAARALKRGRGRPNIAEAIRLVCLSDAGDLDQALNDERSVFQRLRRSDDAAALRYLFFAERRAESVEGLDMTLARSVTHVGVIGGGTMGQGIVRALLASGLQVTLAERDPAALQRAIIALQATKGRLTETEHRDCLSRLIGSADLADIAHCTLVVEAVFEDMTVKKDLLSRLETVLSPDGIIATNTSYLDIDEMAQGLRHRDRVLGLHFFSPADVMPLLEIVRAKHSSDRVIATALKLSRRLGKQAVIARVAEGFIGNRIYAAYRRRAELLVLDGAQPQQVDKAMRAFGFPMGPFEVADMSGLDIAWAMRKRRAETRDRRERYVTIADRLCEAGRLGRKTGRGWYDYADNKQMDSELLAIIAAARAEAGVVPQSFDDLTIQRQLMMAVVNEAVCLLEDGVAQRASDVDVTFVNGYGFPRWMGGPLYWAAHQPAEQLAGDLALLAAAVGFGHRNGDLQRFLDEIRNPAQSSGN